MNNQDPKDWNIDSMVAAVIADDPEAISIAQSLKKSLKQAQAGQYTPAYTPSMMATTQSWLITRKFRCFNTQGGT